MQTLWKKHSAVRQEQQLLYILLLWLEENHRITYIGKDP